jgi:hypothetical protein
MAHMQQIENAMSQNDCSPRLTDFRRYVRQVRDRSDLQPRSARRFPPPAKVRLRNRLVDEMQRRALIPAYGISFQDI